MANELNAVIQMGGKFLKHAVGVLLLCWRRMLRAGLVAGLVAVVLGELAAMAITHSLNPGGPAQLVVAALAIALAYGAALTVLVEEFIQGVVETLRLLEGDVAAGARASAVLAEREIGEVHIGLKHLLGLAAPVAWVSARAKATREAAAARQEQRERAEAAATQRRAQQAAVAQRRAAQEQAQRDQLAAQTRQRQATEERARQERLAEQTRIRNERQAQQEHQRQQEQADQFEREKRRRAAEASAAALTAGGATAIAAAALAAQATQGQRHAAATPPPPAPHDASQDHPEVSVASVTQLPPVVMQPVLASSLPRIEWTYDQYDQHIPIAPPPPAVAPLNNIPAATATPTTGSALGADRDAEAPDEPLAPARFATAAAATAAATDDATDDMPAPADHDGAASTHDMHDTEEAASTVSVPDAKPVATPMLASGAPNSPTPDETAAPSQPGDAANVTAPAQRPAAWVAPAIAIAAASAAIAGAVGVASSFGDHAHHDSPGSSSDSPPPVAANAQATPQATPRAITQPLAWQPDDATSALDALDATTQPARASSDTRPLQAPPPADAAPDVSDPTDYAATGVRSPLGADPTRDPARRRATQPLRANTRPLSADTQPLGAITQPLGAVTRPLPALTRPRPANSGGLWERISQALVGRTPATTRPVTAVTPTDSVSPDATDPFGEITSLPPMPAADEDQT